MFVHVVVVDAKGYWKQVKGMLCLERSLEDVTERNCQLTHIYVHLCLYPVHCKSVANVLYNSENPRKPSWCVSAIPLSYALVCVRQPASYLYHSPLSGGQCF